VSELEGTLRLDETVTGFPTNHISDGPRRKFPAGPKELLMGTGFTAISISDGPCLDHPGPTPRSNVSPGQTRSYVPNNFGWTVSGKLNSRYAHPNAIWTRNPNPLIAASNQTKDNKVVLSWGVGGMRVGPLWCFVRSNSDIACRTIHNSRGEPFLHHQTN
jgi:hypothetical protein